MKIGTSLTNNYPWHTDSLLFYCRIDGGTLQPQTQEVRQAAFFARDQLPSPFLDGEPNWVDQAFAWHEGRERQVYFDNIGLTHNPAAELAEARGLCVSPKHKCIGK